VPANSEYVKMSPISGSEVLKLPTTELVGWFSAILLDESNASVGLSFTAFTVMVNVCAVELSTPPLAVPPLSFSTTVIVAVPLAFVAEVKVSVPLAAMAGAAENKAAFVLPVTWNVSVWAASSAGPAESAVAQPAMLCAPQSSLTVTFVPLVKVGRPCLSPSAHRSPYR
jgi:hypothetical protein